MKKNNALLIVIAMVLVLTFGLVACNDSEQVPSGEKTTYTVTIPTGEGYTVVGATSVKEGEDYSFQVNVAEGYNGTDMVVKVNGNIVVKTDNAYKVAAASGNLVITVTGVKKNAPNTYSVTLPSGNGYTISGETVVTAGSNYTFTITVLSGYNVDALVVKNGETILTYTSKQNNQVAYTIQNVQSNIDLQVTLDKTKFSVTLPNGEGYAVVGANEAVYGEDYTFTLNAVSGYSISDAVVKNGDVTLTGNNGTYTIENVEANIVITISNVKKLQDYVSVTTKTYNLKLSDITTEQKAAAYYMTGVSGVYQDAECDVTADLSAIDFTTAGSYTITYKLLGHETITDTATINIYGTPTIAVNSSAVKSINWSKDLNIDSFINTLMGQVSAVDSLNESLTVSVKSATVPTKNVYGYYDIQSYNVTFTAEDIMGNSKDEVVQITIADSSSINVATTLNIDLSNTAVALAEYEAGVDFDLYRYDANDGLVAVTTQEAAYDSTNEATYFASAYLAALELGEHKFVLVFEDTFKVVTLTLTDDEAPAYTLSNETSFAYLVGENFVLPTAVKNANSAQNITVKYFLGDNEFTTNPTEEGSYTYTVKFYRDNTLLSEYTKTYSLTLVENYGWSGATVSATTNGKIALTGTYAEGETYKDVTATLSSEYISANIGENNVVVVKIKTIDEGTNTSTVEGCNRGIWWINGVEYITEEGNPENYEGKTPNLNEEITLKLKVENDGNAVFTIRNFDGKVEVTSITFEKHEAYVADPNFTKGYAESVNLTYNTAKTRITNVVINVPANKDWWTNTPGLSTTYTKALYDAGVRYVTITPTYTTKDGEGLIYQYYDEAQTKNIELQDLSSGQSKILALVSEKAISFSKVNNAGGEGKTAADTISVAFTYYTQEEYDAAQAELAKATAKEKLALITTSEGNFWNYIHLGAWGTNNWGTDNKVVVSTSSNFAVQKALIEDAETAGYKYLKVRIKAEDTGSAVTDKICLESYQGTSYDASFVGNNVVFRIDLSTYYNDTFAEDNNNVVKIFAKDGDTENTECNLTMEVIGFEEENNKYLVSVGEGAGYTLDGATYAEITSAETASFTIKAIDGYTIDSVTCDGASVATNGNVYTISNATKDATLIVATHVSRYTITVSESPRYTVDSYSKTVDEGSSVTFTITANTDWAIDSVSADNGATVVAGENNVYTISNVTTDTTLTITSHSTAVVNYDVTVADGEGFNVAETLPVVSSNGASVTLTITAKTGYSIDSVTADNSANVVAGENNVYTISNISANTTVTVTTTNVAKLKAEAQAKIAAITQSEGNFYTYFKIGAWGDNTWGTDNTVVNFKGKNFVIDRQLIDDALTAGYTHMKFHLVAVAQDGTSTINDLTMITTGTGASGDYYWKAYSGSESDIRIDLAEFAKEGHTTDYLQVNVNNASQIESNLTMSAIEFFASEETTTWTKSDTSVYIANENGALVLDTISAGNDAYATSDEAWFQKYSTGNEASQRTLMYYDYTWIIQKDNTRNMLWGYTQPNKSPLESDTNAGTIKYINNMSNGSTLCLGYDTEGVASIKFADFHSNRNSFGGFSYAQGDNSITVTSIAELKLYFNELTALKEKYKYIRFTVSDPSALTGQVLVGNDVRSGDNSGMTAITSSDTSSKLVDLSKCDSNLVVYFTAAETSVTISYEFIVDYKADSSTELVAEGLDSTKKTIIKFKYESQGSNTRSPIFGKTSATAVNAINITECTDLGDGWYQYEVSANSLDTDGNLYLALDSAGSFFYEITQE